MTPTWASVIQIVHRQASSITEKRHSKGNIYRGINSIFALSSARHLLSEKYSAIHQFYFTWQDNWQTEVEKKSRCSLKIYFSFPMIRLRFSWTNRNMFQLKKKRKLRQSCSILTVKFSRDLIFISFYKKVI